MKTSQTISLFIVALASGSTVLAQPADTYVSGLLHHPLGGITSFTVDGRRLSACCLGSSGEDGVEVLFSSVFGGGVSVDLTDMLWATGVAREIRIRPKGWDGTVKGSARISSDADGNVTEVYDFSTIGVASLDWRLLGAQGEVIDQGSEPSAVLTWDLAVAPGAVWQKGFAVVAGPSGFAADQGFFDRAVTVTGPSGVPVSGVYATEVTPVPCLGCASQWTDIESILLTGSDIAELVLSDANLLTFGVPSWGVGQAHIDEECIGFPPPCAGSDLGVVASNIGTSGVDGVSFGADPNSGGFSASVVKEKCCRGHVIIMKLYDDEGQEQRISRTQIDELAPLEELDADFSSLGATGFRLTLYDALGDVIGPPAGTEFIGSGPRPHFLNNCPDDQVEGWINTGAPTNPVWIFNGCASGYDFELPGYGTVAGVDSYHIEPVGLTSSVGRLAQCTVITDDSDGLMIKNVAFSHVASGDVNWDGAVDLADWSSVAACVAGPGETSPPAGCDAGAFSRCNLDGDGDVDLKDCDVFQRAFTTP